MAAIGRPQMLAQLIEADIHQDHRVNSVFAVPRIHTAMRGPTFEGEFGADQRIILQAVTGGRAVADMGEDRGIDILEVAVTNQVRPAHQLFFGWTDRDYDG